MCFSSFVSNNHENFVDSVTWYKGGLTSLHWLCKAQGSLSSPREALFCNGSKGGQSYEEIHLLKMILESWPKLATAIPIWWQKPECRHWGIGMKTLTRLFVTFHTEQNNLLLHTTSWPFWTMWQYSKYTLYIIFMLYKNIILKKLRSLSVCDLGIKTFSFSLLSINLTMTFIVDDHF